MNSSIHITLPNLMEQSIVLLMCCRFKPFILHELEIDQIKASQIDDKFTIATVKIQTFIILAFVIV